MLTTDLATLVEPVFTGSWVTLPASEQQQAIEVFVTLHKFVGKLRQQFDDTLTTEHAKGNLSDIEHIRKPRETKAAEPKSMADFIKGLK